MPKTNHILILIKFQILTSAIGSFNSEIFNKVMFI
jgi:hypothetical protein